MKTRRVAPLSAALLLAGLALAACDRADMIAQPKANDWDRNRFFADQSAMRRPVPGTEPRDEPNRPVAQPVAITAALMQRGRERYDIFCSPCHGRTGDARGMIVRRGFPPPPALGDPALVKADAGVLYDVITRGHGAMYAYADRVPPADRWAIVAYIRALQLSGEAPAALLDAADRAALDRGP